MIIKLSVKVILTVIKKLSKSTSCIFCVLLNSKMNKNAKQNLALIDIG